MKALWCDQCCRWIPIGKGDEIHTCYDARKSHKLTPKDVARRKAEKITYRDFADNPSASWFGDAVSRHAKSIDERIRSLNIKGIPKGEAMKIKNKIRDDILKDAAFPMLNPAPLVQDWPVSAWYRSHWRLLMGADAGAIRTSIIWALVGRYDPHDDFDTFIILHNIKTRMAISIPDLAAMIVDEHIRMDYPKAAAIFMGSQSIPQDTMLALELDKKCWRSKLFLPSWQSPDGRRCIRCDREGRSRGWKRIGSLLQFQKYAKGTDRPALMFCAGAEAIYRALLVQKDNTDEAHEVAALRYVIRGWEQCRFRILEDTKSQTGIA